MISHPLTSELGSLVNSCVIGSHLENRSKNSGALIIKTEFVPLDRLKIEISSQEIKN